jgi:hypothetical protein
VHGVEDRMDTRVEIQLLEPLPDDYQLGPSEKTVPDFAEQAGGTADAEPRDVNQPSPASEGSYIYVHKRVVYSLQRGFMLQENQISAAGTAGERKQTHT